MRWKMGSFRLHNPFCSIGSRAKTRGYKCVSINWHRFKHDALSTGTQNRQNYKVVNSHFLTWTLLHSINTCNTNPGMELVSQ